MKKRKRTGYYYPRPTTRRVRSRRRYYRRSKNLAIARTGGLIDMEKKYLDVYKSESALISGTSFAGLELQPSSGCTDCLSAPAQGDGSQQRDGLKIKILSILVKGYIKVDADNAGDTEVPRVVPKAFLALVVDTQTNGATIVSEDVYTNLTGVNAGTILPQRNMSNTTRFKVLRAKMVSIQSHSIATDSSNNVLRNGGYACFTMKYKFKTPLSVRFTTGGTSANVANVTDNSIHLIGGVSNTALAPTISYVSRIRFVG